MKFISFNWFTYKFFLWKSPFILEYKNHLFHFILYFENHQSSENLKLISVNLFAYTCFLLKVIREFKIDLFQHQLRWWAAQPGGAYSKLWWVLHRDHHKHQYLDYNHDHHYLDYRHIQYIQSFGESLHHYHHYDHHDHHYLDYKHIEITSIFRALVSLFTNGESPLSPLWSSRLTNENPIPWKPASLKMTKSGVTKIWLFLHSIAHVMVWSFKWKHIACYVDCVMSQLDIRHKICYKSPHKDHCTIPGIVYLWCTHCGAQRALREKLMSACYCLCWWCWWYWCWWYWLCCCSCCCWCLDSPDIAADADDDL